MPRKLGSLDLTSVPEGSRFDIEVKTGQHYTLVVLRPKTGLVHLYEPGSNLPAQVTVVCRPHPWLQPSRIQLGLVCGRPMITDRLNLNTAPVIRITPIS